MEANNSPAAGSALPSRAKPFVNPYVGGAILGVVLFLAFLLTGNGLGASGGIARVLVSMEDKVAPEHVDRTAYLLKMAGGDKNPLNSWIVFVTLGVLLGSFVSSLVHRRLKVETQKGPRISVKTRWLLAFLGGTLMGYGARLARGCTSGQGLSGAATLAVGSWVFLMAVFAGGFALAWFVRKEWN